jgi:hypothetical protein
MPCSAGIASAGVRISREMFPRPQHCEILGSAGTLRTKLKILVWENCKPKSSLSGGCSRSRTADLRLVRGVNQSNINSLLPTNRRRPAAAPSRPGELHPQPLTDPYVSLSTHTARVIQRRPTMSFIQIEGFFPLPVDHNESIMNRMTCPLRSTGVTQLHRYYEAVCPWCEHRYFRSHGLSTCTFSLAISRPGSHVSHWSPYQGHAACTPAAV